MARVVVIGGGYGGLAAAARLAKLGHEVTLLERAAETGGALGTVERLGFTWDAGPTSTLMPAPMRDLFRKEIKPRLAYGPLRVAVSGRRVSPPLFESLEILGKESSPTRLRALAAQL